MLICDANLHNHDDFWKEGTPGEGDNDGKDDVYSFFDVSAVKNKRLTFTTLFDWTSAVVILKGGNKSN